MDTPDPEKVKLITKDAINILRDKKPDMIDAPPQLDIERLMDEVAAKARKIHSTVLPMYETARDTGMPLDQQHKMRISELHRLWLDELMRFNHDEVLFLCALVHASTMKDSFV